MKVIDFIDEHVRTFIAACPYVVIATANAAGVCDASPRGGEPGFVKVLSEKHLLIAEASGNRRADSIVNMLENPSIGMIFSHPRIR
jgi:predicted pyridoxine 5'-phosphate oxidase superfamily flavin-nucleotide-binding protein